MEREVAMLEYPSATERNILSHLTAIEQRLAKLGAEIETLAALVAKLVAK
jgi:hypothetical protein